ncbi:MAG TPA: hypothetical protein VMU07_00345 [Candidatus Paceibacterota bacterium]|nr:hypothetical protein [Candidatus Paceibacterota bacterium]
MRKGQSMVEVLVAVAIGAFLVGAAAGLIAPALKSSDQVAQVQVGAALGTELLNNVRVWAESNWHDFLNLSTGTAYRYYLVTGSSPFIVADGSEDIVTSNGVYSRYFYVSDVYRDGTGNITTSGGTYDPSTKQVTAVYSLLNEHGGTGAIWNVGSANSTTQGPAPSFVWGNTLYAVSLPDGLMYFSPIAATGSIGPAWYSTTTPLTDVGGGAAEYNGYAYITALGGAVPPTPSTTVWYAKLSPTLGVSGSWATTTPLSSALGGAIVEAYNGYLYAIGGIDVTQNPTTTVLFAPIKNNGSIGAWSSTSPLPATNVAHGPPDVTVFYNKNVYFVAGIDAATTSAWYAPINTTGSLGAWTSTIPLPNAYIRSGIAATGGYFYIVGGGNVNFITSTVYSAAIAPSGALTSWQVQGSLPSAIGGSWAVANNFFLYDVGGFNATSNNSWSSTLYYTNFVTYGFSAVSSSMSTYVSRNRNVGYTQADWSGGSGQTGPATTANSKFSTSTGINYSVPGALSLSFSQFAGTVTSSFVQVTTSSIAAGTSTQAVFGSNLAASDTLVVAARWTGNQGATILASDVQGNHFNSITGVLDDADGTTGVELWYATGTTAGADGVRIRSNVSQQISVQAFEYKNMQNSTLDAWAWNTSSTGTALDSGATTTSYSNDLVFGFGMTGATTLLPGSGFTARAINGPTLSEDEIVSTAGSYDTTMTQDSANNWLMVQADFPLAGAAASSPNISSSTSQHWAWNDTIGWIDFYGTNSVIVNGSGLQGYASSSAGDISIDCHTTRNGNICNGTNNYQVKNDGFGDLGGWAWNDQYGWISFFWGNASASSTATTTATCQSYGNYCGVYIDNNGVFHGYAWNDTIGWISFNNCDVVSGCRGSSYDVVTSWIPATAYGSLDSTIYDTGVAAGTQLNSVLWQGNLPAGASVGFQFAVSNASSGPWNYEGPSGDGTTWYTVNPGVSRSVDYSLFNGFRYFRYRMGMWQGLGNGASSSPTIGRININWSP